MSISATLQQAAADKAKQENDARMAKVNDAFNKMADELPALLKEISEVALLRAKPATGLMGYFKNAAANNTKREEKRNKKLEIRMAADDLINDGCLPPEGLEKFSGYRRLREYCAQPQVDIGIDCSIAGSSFSLRVCPTESFATSKVTVHPAYDYYDDEEDFVYKPPTDYSIPEFLAKNAATLAPPQVASKIPVMSPLKLKG